MRAAAPVGVVAALAVAAVLLHAGGGDGRERETLRPVAVAPALRGVPPELIPPPEALRPQTPPPPPQVPPAARIDPDILGAGAPCAVPEDHLAPTPEAGRTVRPVCLLDRPRPQARP